MPAKQQPSPDKDRAKRIREAAQEAGVDNDPASFERAFAAVARAKKPANTPKPGKK